VTLERLGCIPTRSIGTRNSLFYLKNLPHLLEVKFELRNSYNCLVTKQNLISVDEYFSEIQTCQVSEI